MRIGHAPVCPACHHPPFQFKRWPPPPLNRPLLPGKVTRAEQNPVHQFHVLIARLSRILTPPQLPPVESPRVQHPAVPVAPHQKIRPRRYASNVIGHRKRPHQRERPFVPPLHRRCARPPVLRHRHPQPVPLHHHAARVEPLPILNLNLLHQPSLPKPEQRHIAPPPLGVN